MTPSAWAISANNLRISAIQLTTMALSAIEHFWSGTATSASPAAPSPAQSAPAPASSDAGQAAAPPPRPRTLFTSNIYVVTYASITGHMSSTRSPLGR